MNTLKANIISIIITLVASAIGAVAILNYKSLIFWNQLDESFEIKENFDQYTPEISAGSVRLYKDFVMAAPIVTENIKAISQKIRIKGKVNSGTLHAKASPTGFGADKTRIHTIYFYIDNGTTGGHLAAERENSRIVKGGFRIGDPPYELNINAEKFVVARGNSEQKEIRLLDILNDNKEHWIGAFVSTGIYGILNNLTLEYICSIDTPECKIELVE